MFYCNWDDVRWAMLSVFMALWPHSSSCAQFLAKKKGAFVPTTASELCCMLNVFGFGGWFAKKRTSGKFYGDVCRVGEFHCSKRRAIHPFGKRARWLSVNDVQPICCCNIENKKIFRMESVQCSGLFCWINPRNELFGNGLYVCTLGWVEGTYGSVPFST